MNINSFVVTILNQQLCLDFYSLVNIYSGVFDSALNVMVFTRLPLTFATDAIVYNVMNKYASLNILVHGVIDLFYYERWTYKQKCFHVFVTDLKWCLLWNSCTLKSATLYSHGFIIEECSVTNFVEEWMSNSFSNFFNSSLLN